MNDFMLTARLLLGLVFALSSIAKLQAPRDFSHGIESYRILPGRVNDLAAAILIVLEGAISVALLTGYGAWQAIPLAATLLLLFMGITVQNARREEPLPCYCFGIHDSTLHPRQNLLRIVLILANTLVVLKMWIAGEATLLGAQPTVEHLLTAFGVLVLSTWLLAIPALFEFHLTPVPQFAHPGTRISLRNLGLDAPSNVSIRR